MKEEPCTDRGEIFTVGLVVAARAKMLRKEEHQQY